MDRTVIVTGGSGGLGVPVVQAFLDADWRVVVPWVAERELDRLPEREGLELVQADLFDAGDVDAVVEVAAGYEGAPLHSVVNLVGGFSAPGKVADTPIDDFEAQFRINLRPLYLIAAAAMPHLQADGGTLVAVSTRRAAPVRRRRRLLLLEGRRDRVHRLPGRRVQGRRRTRQRDRAEHHRHAGQPRLAARRRHREVGQAGADRPDRAVALLRRVERHERRRCPRVRPRLGGVPTRGHAGGIRGAIRASDGVGGTCRKEESRRGTERGREAGGRESSCVTASGRKEHHGRHDFTAAHVLLWG